MSQDFRKRVMSSKSSSFRSTSSTESVKKQQSSLPRQGLTCSSVLGANPQEHGLVHKLHVPLVYEILPEIIQKLISLVWFLAFYLAPRWKPRYMVLLGSYLYKYSAKQDAEKSERLPKGAPISVEAIDVNVLEPKELPWLPNLPNGCEYIVSMQSVSSTTYFAVSDREQAQVWVNSMREAKQEAIKRRMGHSPNGSYPQSWAYFDSLGKDLVKRKARIKRKMQGQNMRELEMDPMSVNGGPSPRGYYG